MFNILPQIIIILALVGIIVIIVRRLPKVAELEEKPKSHLRTVLPGRFRTILSKIKNIVLRFGHLFKDVLTNLFYRAKNKAKAVKAEKSIRNPKAEMATLVSEKPTLVTQKDQEIEEKVIDLLEKASTAMGGNDLFNAEKNYIEIIKLDSKNIRAYKGLGKIYLKQNNLSDAKSSYEQVIKLDPQDKEATAELAQLSQKMPT